MSLWWIEMLNIPDMLISICFWTVNISSGVLSVFKALEHQRQMKSIKGIMEYDKFILKFGTVLKCTNADVQFNVYTL